MQVLCFIKISHKKITCENTDLVMIYYETLILL